MIQPFSLSERERWRRLRGAACAKVKHSEKCSLHSALSTNTKFSGTVRNIFGTGYPRRWTRLLWESVSSLEYVLLLSCCVTYAMDSFYESHGLLPLRTHASGGGDFPETPPVSLNEGSSSSCSVRSFASEPLRCFNCHASGMYSSTAIGVFSVAYAGGGIFLQSFWTH